MSMDLHFAHIEDRYINVNQIVAVVREGPSSTLVMTTAIGEGAIHQFRLSIDTVMDAIAHSAPPKTPIRRSGVMK